MKKIILLFLLIVPFVFAENYTCPDCICNFNYSMITFPKINYSLFNYSGFPDNFTFPEFNYKVNYSEFNFSFPSCLDTNYSLSCPELSCENVVCPSYPALTEEEKKSIAEIVVNRLSEEGIVTVGLNETIELFVEDRSYYGEEEKEEEEGIEGDYWWYGGICFGLALLVLLIIKRKPKKNKEEKIEYLEAE